MNRDPVKAGMIGFGMSGRVFQAPFIDLSDRFEFSAVVQRSSASAREVYPEINVVQSHGDLLSDPSIELVVVSTPNELHVDMARQALLAGKHVVVEKPVAPTVAAFSDLIDLARTQGKCLFAFHNRRWDGDFKTVKKIVDNGLIGDVVEYEARYNRYKPALNPKPWKEQVGPASGILYDLGTHIIDQAVCLFGAPVSVSAKLYKQREGTRIDDAFDLCLDYPVVKVTLKSSLLVKDPALRYQIYGRNGSFLKSGTDPQESDAQVGLSPSSPQWGLDAEQNWGMLTTSLHGLEFKGTLETLRGNYAGFYDNVFDVIRNGADYAIAPEEALVTTAIIEAAIKSHHERRTIDLSEIADL